MTDINQILGKLLGSNLAGGFAGGLAGGLASNVLTSKSGRKMGKNALKMGGVAQPLFSAFGDDSLEVRLASAETTAILTTQKHVKKVRKILDRLPDLEFVIVVDADDKPLKEREVALDLNEGADMVILGISPRQGLSAKFASHTTEKVMEKITVDVVAIS